MQKVWKTAKRKNELESAIQMRNRVNKKFEPGDLAESTSRSLNDVSNATLVLIIIFKIRERRGKTLNVSRFGIQKIRSVDAAARITIAMAKSMQVARGRSSWNRRKLPWHQLRFKI